MAGNDGRGSSAGSATSIAHDLHRSNQANERDSSLMQAAELAAGLGRKSRDEWTEEEVNRVYNAVALAPAGVNTTS